MLLALLTASACGSAAPRAGSARPAPQAPHPDAKASARVCSAPYHADPRHPTSAELSALEAGCRDEPVCGCATLGDVLVSSDDPARAARGVEVLEGACSAGALGACDELTLTIALCARDPRAETSPICQTLAKHAQLALEPRLELSDLLGCWHVSGQRYECACLQPKRVFLRLKSGAWDAFAVDWQRVTRTLFASPVPALGAHLGVASRPGTDGHELRLMFASTPSLFEIVQGLALTRPSGAEEHHLRAEVAALPDVAQACARARRCVTTANDLLAPPLAGDTPAPVVISVALGDADSLLQCSEAREQVLAFLALKKVIVPGDCR